MYRFILLSMAAFTSVCFSYAQDELIRMQNRYVLGLQDYINYEHIDRNMAKTSSYENIKGSPFISKDFADGQIRLNNGKIYKGPLRYDIYADQIEFKTSTGEIYAVLNPETVDTAVIGKNKFKYLAPEENKSVNGFYEMLVEGNFTLFEKHQIILKDPQAARPYVEAKPARFETKESKFVIQDANGKLTEIKNKNDLLLSESNTEKLELFIKKNKIKPSDKNDMIRFVEFLNQ